MVVGAKTAAVWQSVLLHTKLSFEFEVREKSQATDWNNSDEIFVIDCMGIWTTSGAAHNKSLIQITFPYRRCKLAPNWEAHALFQPKVLVHIFVTLPNCIQIFITKIRPFKVVLSLWWKSLYLERDILIISINSLAPQSWGMCQQFW